MTKIKTSISNNFKVTNALEQGSIAPLLLGLIVVVLIAVLTPYFIFGKVVPPDQIGVRRNFFGVAGLLEGGFASKGLPPGLHWQIPFVSEVSLKRRGLQYVTFSNKAIEGEDTVKKLVIITTDGAKVETDVTMVLRFFERPGGEEDLTIDEKVRPETKLDPAPKAVRKIFQHGGPRDLLSRYKDERSEILSKVAERAENALNQNLSPLSTSDFYNPVLREQAALNTQEILAKSLAADGIELWGTLIRRYSYEEPKIDDQIFAKNLQDQTERLNAAASKLAFAKAETEKQRANWDAQIESLKVQGQSSVNVTLSQAELYESSKKAEGDLLVASSHAEVDTRRAKALSEIQGADVYVARELAPLLKSLKGGVISDLDPYDVDAWIKKLVGSPAPVSSDTVN